MRVIGPWWQLEKEAGHLCGGRALQSSPKRTLCAWIVNTWLKPGQLCHPGQVWMALCSSLHPGMVTKAAGKQLWFTGSLEEVEVASTLLICWDERLVWACRAPEANLREREIHTGKASSEASGRLQVSVPANLLNLLISSRNCHSLQRSLLFSTVFPFNQQQSCIHP